MQITNVNQLNCNDRISYSSCAGQQTATVRFVRIGKNAAGVMTSWLNIRVDAKGNRLAHNIELLGGNSIPMYNMKKI